MEYQFQSVICTSVQRSIIPASSIVPRPKVMRKKQCIENISDFKKIEILKKQELYIVHFRIRDSGLRGKGE